MLIVVVATLLAVIAVAAAVWVQSTSSDQAQTRTQPQQGPKSPKKDPKQGKGIAGSAFGRSGSTNPASTAQLPETPELRSGSESVKALPQERLPQGGGSLDGYVAQLGSFQDRQLAEDRQSTLEAEGTDAFVVRSDNYEQLTPGYWVVLSGPFDFESEASEAASNSGVPDAFPRWISG